MVEIQAQTGPHSARNGAICRFACGSAPAYGSKVRSFGPMFFPGLKPGASTGPRVARLVVIRSGIVLPTLRFSTPASENRACRGPRFAQDGAPSVPTQAKNMFSSMTFFPVCF